MIKILLVPMFVLPFIASLCLFRNYPAQALTWFGISLANIGIWFQTT